MGGISLWQLGIVLAIIILLFGTKKLRTLGSDLGNSIKGFKNAVADPAEKQAIEKPKPAAEADFEVTSELKEKV